MAFEEVFAVELPVHESGGFGSPQAMVDRLDLYLSNRRPNNEAAALLRKLAKDHNTPELAEALEGTWRREQIAGIVREIFPQ
jgi:hypothetical protein